MLAMATGWTPQVIGSVPDVFRRACHWALYVRARLPEGIPAIPSLDRGAAPAARLEVAKLRASLNDLRSDLFPEDD